MKPVNILELSLPLVSADRLTPLWGAGVGIETHAGISLMALLGGQLGVDSDYIDQRIQTVFVNGRAVDRIDEVFLTADAVVALSAAMPGLVGATFRKEGLLAGFRRDISHAPSAMVDPSKEKTIVTLKLFNMIAEELGPGILQRERIFLKGRQVKDLLQMLDRGDAAGQGAVHWSGRVLGDDDLNTLDVPDGWVALRIDFRAE